MEQQDPAMALLGRWFGAWRPARQALERLLDRRSVEDPQHTAHFDAIREQLAVLDREIKRLVGLLVPPEGRRE